MTISIEKHPCFNDESRHTFGRIHLPVAPKCNIQCNYCNRKFDCLNENRPGVTSKVLTPHQALLYLDKAVKLSPNISVVGIAGPGDPFANPEETMETLRLVRKNYPDMLLCVATNGLNVLDYIDELKELQVSHVTLTINAIDPQIGAEIYAWVRHRKKMYRDTRAAEMLLHNQLEALKKLKASGITAKINAIIIPGINDRHIVDVARATAEMGADIFNCLPYYNTRETVFENIPEPHPELVTSIQRKTSQYLPQMKHCARCRADAVGIIGQDNSDALMKQLQEAATMPRKPDEHRPYVAVTSMEGVLINQHLGEAARFLIYSMPENSDRPVFIESREAPPAGGGSMRWEAVASQLSDCRALLVNGVGPSPEKVLKTSGIDVYTLDGVIEEGVSGIYTGKDMSQMSRISQMHACKTSCSGTGGGCG